MTGAEALETVLDRVDARREPDLHEALARVLGEVTSGQPLADVSSHLLLQEWARRVVAGVADAVRPREWHDDRLVLAAIPPLAGLSVRSLERRLPRSVDIEASLGRLEDRGHVEAVGRHWWLTPEGEAAR